MRSLLDTIREGFPDDSRHAPHVAPYWRYRDGLYESDGVVMFNDRVVVPNVPVSARSSRLRRKAAESGILKRMLENQV